MAEFFFCIRKVDKVMKEERIYSPQFYTDDKLSGVSGVYQIRNITNGKLYVGSAKNLFTRKNRQHLTQLRSNTHKNEHLQNAWNEYGEENFIFEIIEFCNPNIRLEIEQYWIDKLNVLDRRFGYNIKPKTTSGELHPESILKIKVKATGRKLSEEAKQKLSRTRREKFASGEFVSWNKGKTGIFSVEALKKMSEKQKERFKNPENNPMYGKHHTEESKQKMREARVKYKGENALNKISIIDLYDNSVYCSMQICSQKTNISEQTIIKHCKNRVKAIPQRFMYYTDYLESLDTQQIILYN